MPVGKQTLIALDTNHIKQYVFATDRLKEIRGASSILDSLNRYEMENLANKFDTTFNIKVKSVYANGGSGQFLVYGDKEQAERFGLWVQKEYHRQTRGNATISFAVQEVPEGVDPWHDDIQSTLQLLGKRLLIKKALPQETLVLPSHPLLRPCDSCGVQYAEGRDRTEERDPADEDKRFCTICLAKRKEDHDVKEKIDDLIAGQKGNKKTKYSYIWQNIIDLLIKRGYDIPERTKRPNDFNELRDIGGGKDYLGLIYADGNGMGKLLDTHINLSQRQNDADVIDNSIYEALSIAIQKHLPVLKEHQPPMFPFDILMLGGDDIIIVTPAAFALDVALTLAKEFHRLTKDKELSTKKEQSLSVGIVLAPIKYPFRLLQAHIESTLKYAKKVGAKHPKPSDYASTMLNFLVVAGGTSHDFGKVYKTLRNKDVQVTGQGTATFYATLRPYTVEEMEILLDAIRKGKKLALGRTKLHQMREAVLKMNLTTSVGEALAVLRNWRTRQRDFVIKEVYRHGDLYSQKNEDQPDTFFPRVTFPWFVAENGNYRTPLLDYTELYDFVAQAGGEHEN